MYIRLACVAAVAISSFTATAAKAADPVDFTKQILPIFMEHCAGCHGARGSGNAPAGWPRLAGQHADYIAQQLRRWRTGAENTLEENPEGRTNDGDARLMRDVALRLTDNEIDAVANFIAGLH